MVEKKFVVDGLKLSYSGPFDVVEFYKKVEEWIAEKGKEKDVKKKVEHVEAKGKNIEWFVEIWEDLAEYARPIVRLRALFSDVKEVKVKRGKSKKRLNKGNALIILDGILETDMGGKWQQKALFHFMRALVDKYIYRYHFNKYDDQLAKEVYELHDVLKDFFDGYKI
ncbi:hypothetical protein KY366_01950 [Candidatus Woesearchaeota archaeon]|nr:hypothetical protein [Candidatus Woesearchaeota archaeon]